MLQKLSIRNYALINELDIAFDSGLNMITGETGAGKSIMIGALSLILGQRAESKYFFNQDKKCIIEGHFQLKGDSLRPLFEELDVDFSRETILRREISTDGKSRAFVNDTLVNLTVLKEVGEKLVDIHSQHATRELNDSDFQLSVIDTLAGHAELLETYRGGFRQLKKDKARLAALELEAAESRSRQDYEQFLFSELENARLQEGEKDAHEKELEQLSNAEHIKKALFTAAGLLNDSEQAASVLLKEAVHQLAGIEKFGTEFESLNERLRSALIEIRDIGDEVLGLEEKTQMSPGRLEFLEQRLDLIYSLEQKHRVQGIEALLAVMNNLADNLSRLQSSDEEIARLSKDIVNLETTLAGQAARLSKDRKAAAPKAEKELATLLASLSMPGAQVIFQLSSQNSLGKDGTDQINLLFSANAGQSPAPVNKVASGGELSRLMLAIKSILAQKNALPAIIFDEIDTGISGETALRVAQVMDDLSGNLQVICITHLPQIAARGKAHFFVHKKAAGERTTTGIRRLEPEERVAAIAEMLSGKNPGASALENARELLG
ncbi:DNA repair protein RecN [Pedobacter yulinensis]|uniref:DNA repair protein RecN n=1 Tax=Pedobacter yulinensis TaxID=2126353 RepID=A0A2T3HHT7_9SPHI|nr:DNA repair protein RecN [Pedobacter yulinensis]PST82004.1 DNA repair protein RecN [Pedobacter yulinensis]